MWQLTEKYSWADKDPDFVCTIAVVTGISASDLVRTYGGDPDKAAPLTFTDA